MFIFRENVWQDYAFIILEPKSLMMNSKQIYLHLFLHKIIEITGLPSQSANRSLNTLINKNHNCLWKLLSWTDYKQDKQNKNKTKIKWQVSNQSQTSCSQAHIPKIVIIWSLFCRCFRYIETFSVTWQVSIKVHLRFEFPLSQYQTHVTAHHRRARRRYSDDSSLSVSGKCNRNNSDPFWINVYT